MRANWASWSVSFLSLAVITGTWALEHDQWVRERREFRTHGCLGFEDARDVLVARRTLPPGRRVTLDDVRSRKMPTQYLDRGGLASVSTDSAEYVLGKAPQRLVLEGDVLRWEDFSP